MHHRKINEIIIHCSANERYSGATSDSIRDFHVKERKYSDIGYHFVIDEYGKVFIGRPLSKVGAHCVGHNKNTIGICYIGGLIDGYPADTRTYQQVQQLEHLVKSLCESFPITKISGHYEYSNKSCPCFDVSIYNKFIKKCYEY